MEQSASTSAPSEAMHTVFQVEEVMQGKPVSLPAPAEGLEQVSLSDATSGPRGSPVAAGPSEGCGHANSCNRAPFLIELFCGSAGVCAQFRTLGGRALGIDHRINRAKLKSAAVQLDLTQDWVQELIFREISSGRVDAVHLGPPCGTASKARSIPIRKTLRRAGAPNPKPLRSSKFPQGFPWLKGVSLLKVKAANCLYEFSARVAQLCQQCNVLFTIENPANSYLWETSFFKRLVDTFHFHVVDACEYGSERKKATAFLANFQSGRLQQRCTGNHVHKPWKVQQSDDGQWKFDTASEAEYPTKLAREIATALLDELLTMKQFKLQDQLEDYAAKVASEAQPRRVRGPLLLSEFKTKVDIHCGLQILPPEHIPEDAVPPFQGVPVGSKRLDVQPVLDTKGEKVSLKVTYGTYFTPEEFIWKAAQLTHPFDMPLPLDSANMDAMAFILTKGPAAVAAHRAKTLSYYVGLAKKLKSEEAALHEGLNPAIKPVLASKRLLLFKEMLQDAGVDDPGLFEDVRDGFRLVGDLKPSGQFQPQWRPASLGVEQLRQTAIWAQQAVIASCKKCAEDEEMAQAVWNDTMDQTAPDKQWVTGPFTAGEITERMGSCWVPSRRFGVRQGGKIRPVDDFSQYLINATVSSHEKIDLEGLDHICSTARFFMGAASDDRSIKFPAGADIPCAYLASDWTLDDARNLVGRCLDLRQAYKQLARHPDDAWAAVLAVYCPSDREVYFFEAIALPFGSISSVLGFNRAARALRVILSRTFKLVTTNFFDDFCQLEMAPLQESAWKTAETVMQLLGWKISDGSDKRRPFAKRFEILGAVVEFKGVPDLRIEVSNKPNRIEQLEEQVRDLRSAVLQTVSRSQLESLKGRLLYAAGHTYGRCTQLACQMLHRLGGTGATIRVSPELVCAVADALVTLKSSKPRVIEPWNNLPPVLVFTDGAVEGDGAEVTHGALLADPALGRSYVFGDTVPAAFVEKWTRHGKKQVIAQAEMLPVLVSKCTWEEALRNRNVLWFLDNESAKMAFVRCFSPVVDNFFMLQMNSKLDVELQIKNWYSRVPSKSNPSDSASRLDMSGYSNATVFTPSYHQLLESLENYEALVNLLEKG